jgi:hypothetical protein
VYPWDGLPLQLEECPVAVDPVYLYHSLFDVGGCFAGVSLDPFIPDRWTWKGNPYVALLLGPSVDKIFEREFVGFSGRVPGVWHGGKQRGFRMELDLSLLEPGVLLEIRSGLEPEPLEEERYQRIFRLDVDGWYHVAFRQSDVGGPDIKAARPGLKKFRLHRFYPWHLIRGVSLF